MDALQLQNDRLLARGWGNPQDCPNGNGEFWVFQYPQRGVYVQQVLVRPAGAGLGLEYQLEDLQGNVVAGPIKLVNGAGTIYYAGCRYGADING